MRIEWTAQDIFRGRKVVKNAVEYYHNCTIACEDDITGNAVLFDTESLRVIFIGTNSDLAKYLSENKYFPIF